MQLYGNNKGGTGNKSNSQGSIAFAKSYFELVGSTKKIKKRDVEFLYISIIYNNIKFYFDYTNLIAFLGHFCIHK